MLELLFIIFILICISRIEKDVKRTGESFENIMSTIYYSQPHIQAQIQKEWRKKHGLSDSEPINDFDK